MMGETIDEFSGDYAFLSNFFIKPFEHNNHYYLTSEHYFQAHKAIRKTDFYYVLSSVDPAEAKKRGREIECREDWENVKVKIMEDALRYKFSDPDMKQRLINTFPKYLIEGNWHGDTIWGVCKRSRKGKNLLGQALMKIRDELMGRK